MSPRAERFAARILDGAPSGKSDARRRAAEEFLRSHPRTAKTAVSYSVLAATLLELVGAQSGMAMTPAFPAFCLMHCALLLLFPFLSRFCSLGLILLHTAFYVALAKTGMPYDGPSQYWGVWLAQAYLGYRMRPAAGIAAALMDSGAHLLDAWALEGTVRGQLSLRLTLPSMLSYDLRRFHTSDFLLVMLALAFAGRCLRWFDQAADLRLAAMEQDARITRAEGRMATMRRNEEAALRIHSSVTKGLASIRSSQDECERNASSLEDTKLFHTLQGRIYGAMEEVGRITERLSAHDGENGPDAAARPLAESLRRIMRDGDARLAAAGFSGQSSGPDGDSSDDIACASPEECEAITSFLGEIYANILSHGTESGSYGIEIRGAGEALSITAWNTARGEEPPACTPRSGKGLGLHRKALERFGGTVDAARHGDRWEIYAQIPLDGRGQGRADEAAPGRTPATNVEGTHHRTRNDREART